MDIKEYLKPPFSNYDIVVYLGCGLFSVPFLNRYLVRPLGLSWPTFRVSTGTPIGDSIVSLLALSFGIYILGHILAYVGSQIIEKWSDTIIGKISTIILSVSDHDPVLRNRRIRNRIAQNLKSMHANRNIFATLIRTIPHLSQLITYCIMYLAGIFGQYNTRITEQVVAHLKRTYPRIGIRNLKVSVSMPWFKPLEYFILNKSPQSATRMYNYLVIAGLFRSVSLVFLLSSTLLVIHAAWARCHGGDWSINEFFPHLGTDSYIIEYLTLSVLYFFSFASYIKFQRRYCEEAIYAFVFFGDTEAPITHPAPVNTDNEVAHG